jgi:hypothetical protein
MFSKWIVVTRYGGIGDLVALEPTLSLLKKQNPDSGIVLRTYNTYLDVLGTVPCLSGIILDSMNFITFPPPATGNYVATQGYPDLWKPGDMVTHYNMQGVPERDSTRHEVSVYLRAAGLGEMFIAPYVPRPDTPANGLTIIQLRNHKIDGVPNDPFRNLCREEIPASVKAHVRVIDPDIEVMMMQQWMNLVAGANTVFASDTGILHLAAAYGVPNIYGYYSPQFPPEIRTYANITSFTDKELFKAKIREICA